MAKKITAAQQELLDDLVGQSEVATELGVTRSLLSMWLQRYDDFPAPVLVRNAGRFWRLTEIREWDAARKAK